MVEIDSLEEGEGGRISRGKEVERGRCHDGFDFLWAAPAGPVRRSDHRGRSCRF